MLGNVRILLPLGPKRKFSHFHEILAKIFAKIRKFARKFKNFRENFFTKIVANSGIIIDVKYVGNRGS
jgi:energy-converting hydrogenase Eha subunit F